MGLREVVLFGFVLLLSCGNLCAATQNWTTNETLTPTPQGPETASSQLLRSASGHQSNRTEQSEPVRAPVSYRLKSYQLRRPVQQPAEHTAPPHSPHRSEATALTSEQLESRGTVQTQGMSKLPHQGPNLNPPVRQESKVLVKFEQRVPVPAASVAARCGEREVTVEVRQKFLGNGQLIRPSDLTLGGCAALHTADHAEHILQFQTELQGCGSAVTMTEGSLVYSFSLMYSPTPIGNTFILKTNPAEVVIECHYLRRHYASSGGAMRPTWRPFASYMLAEQQLRFSLRLMTEDWQSQRPSSVFSLTSLMHIEAAVLQRHHVPLRVFVDSCVASVDPNPSSHPKYSFINNHGCLADAKLTGAKSYFLQRSQEDKLQFQLKAFKFHHDHRNSIYITCHLRATVLSVPIDSQHKACSFLTEAKRWVASDGDNKVCSCCESSCGEQRWRRSAGADAGLHPDLQWTGMVALGPLLLQEEERALQEEESLLQEEERALQEEEGILQEEESLLQEEERALQEKESLLQEEERALQEEERALQEEVSGLLLEPDTGLHTHTVTEAASPSWTALVGGVGAALAVVLLVFMSAIICSRLRKPTGYTVCT